MAYVLFEGRPITTKGRWINVLVLWHLNIQKRYFSLVKVKKPIFIIGIGRSGTTVLGNVLSMHQQVGYLNEPKALWHSIYPFEDLVGNYSSLRATYRIKPNEATPDVTKFAHRLFGAYLTSSFTSRVVDKYPELLFRFSFVKSLFLDAKFLFVVRNGWDVCQSIDHWSERLAITDNNQNHDWWGVNNRKWFTMIDQLVPEHSDLFEYRKTFKEWTNQVDMAALEWILCMREGLKLLEQYPNDILRVDYQKLCSNPSETLNNITQFSELNNNDEKFLDYGVKTLKPRTIKRPILLHSSIEKPFNDLMFILGFEKFNHQFPTMKMNNEQ